MFNNIGIKTENTMGLLSHYDPKTVEFITGLGK